MPLAAVYVDVGWGVSGDVVVLGALLVDADAVGDGAEDAAAVGDGEPTVFRAVL